MDAATSPPEEAIGKILFSWFDYTLFGAMLVLSTLIGIFFGCFGDKQSTASEYLLGGRKMKVFPIAMSLVASHVSGVTLLAVPSDVYNFGCTYWLSCIAVFIVCIVTSYVYLPVFYNLRLTSIYEYLKLRFDTSVRLFASFLFTISIMLYLPIVIYVPALALSQVTDINIHLISPLVCGVCIFYTTIGGLKAVVWTDMLQFIVTVGAMASVFYLGLSSVGGFGAIFEKSAEGGRLSIEFGINAPVRDTFWTMLIGWSSASIAHMGISQSTIQKFASVPTLAKAKASMMWYVLGVITVKSTCVLTGLMMYSKYYKCDPLSSGKINQPDQLLPYFVMEVAGDVPGLPGLFIAGVLCAALSTLSAVMNCLAGTLYEDFISRKVPKDISDKAVSNILKLLVVVIGVIATSLVFVVEHLGGLLAVSITFGSVSQGPLLGLFSLGMLFPMANSKGAIGGSLAGLLVLSWMVIGSQWYKAKGIFHYAPRPLSVDGCTYDFLPKNSTTIPTTSADDVFFLYKIPFWYLTIIGASTTVIVGLIISYFTKKDEKPVRKEFLSPVIHRFLDKEILSKEYLPVTKALEVLHFDEKIN